ncbi:unnamed protein product [Peniophora sp. CBMAI 1063]|nr:unnamed protein product [Peniophora sp. CBMAI 1063]
MEHNTVPNGVSPIERLPPEILQKILSHIGEAFEHAFLHEVYSDSITSLPYGDILGLLVVSQRWHNAATAVVELWTCIPTHAPSETIDTFVRRSGQRPLYLAIDSTRGSWAPRSREKQRQLLHLMPRVRGFIWQKRGVEGESEMESSDDEEVEPADAALSVAEIYTILSAVAAPLLEKLYLDLKSTDRDFDSFLPTLFAGGAPPRLRVLEVFDQKLAKSNPLLNSPLTNLHLIDVYDVWNDGRDMADTLSRMQQLELLRLDQRPESSFFTFDSDDPPSASAPEHTIASLPRLSLLDITDRISSVSEVLEHIAFPLECLISIEAKGTHDGEGSSGEEKRVNLESLMDALNAHYKPAFDSGMSFRAAHVLLRDRRDDRLFLQASHLCKIEDSPFSSGDVDITDMDLVYGKVVKDTRLTLGMVWDLPDIPDVSTSRVVFEQLSALQGLEGLSMSTSNSQRSRQALPDFLVHFPTFNALIARQTRIRWLEMTHYPAWAFSRTPERILSIFHPQLEVICIKNAAFTPVPANSPTQAVPNTLNVDRLEAYLATRASAGRLRMFHVRKCIIDDSTMVSRLREAVGESRWTWDGKILGWS